MTQIVRSVTGAAAATTITAPMTTGSPASGGGTFSVVSGAGYPTANFIVVIDRGTATEEKILIVSRSANVLTVATSGRGYDGTAAAAHSNGATLEHVLDALAVTALLEHVNTNAGDDHGTQYLRRSDAAGAGLGITAGVLAVNVDNSTLEINADTLRAKDLGIVAAKLADNAVTTAKVIDAAITLAKMANLATARLVGRATAGTGVPEALTIGSSLAFVGTALQRAALTGDVTAAADGNATTIGAGKVTAAMHATGTRPLFVVANATARLALSPADGDMAVEQDTDRIYRYQGAAWTWIGGGTNPTAARAYGGAGTSLTNGSFTKISLNTEDYDYGANFASSTYTAPEARDYRIGGRCSVGSLTGANRVMVSIYINGTEKLRGVDLTCGSGGATALGGPVSGRIALAASDTVDLRMFVDVAGKTSDTGFGSAYLEIEGL